jgi:hypothetical protein
MHREKIFRCSETFVFFCILAQSPMARTKESKRKADVVQRNPTEEKTSKSKKTSENCTPKGETTNNAAVSTEFEPVTTTTTTTNEGIKYYPFVSVVGETMEVAEEFTEELTQAQKCNFFFNFLVTSSHSPFALEHKIVGCKILIHEQLEECYPLFLVFKQGPCFYSKFRYNGIRVRGREFLPTYLGLLQYLREENGDDCLALYVVLVAACTTNKTKSKMYEDDRALIEKYLGIDFPTYGDLRLALGGTLEEVEREDLPELGPCLTLSFNGFN